VVLNKTAGSRLAGAIILDRDSLVGGDALAQFALILAVPGTVRRKRLARLPADARRGHADPQTPAPRPRPGPEFTISMRTHWNGKDQGELRERIAAYEAIAVQYDRPSQPRSRRPG
jgi:hypothetical protein